MNRLISALVSLGIGAAVCVAGLSVSGIESARKPKVVQEIPDSCAYVWQKHAVDAHRTGVSIPGKDNFAEALGSVSGKSYTAPNGTVFNGGCTPEAASVMLSYQDKMAYLREIIGYSENGMVKDKPESALSNWAADVLLIRSADIFDQKIDVSVLNFGGIRIDMPKGNIILDDIRSMFPFKNMVCYVRVKGSVLQAQLEKIAARRVAAVGGCRYKVTGGKLTDLTIGGKPLDPKAVYGIATIDFLLDGGDGLSLAADAMQVVKSELKIGDIMEAHIREKTVAGRNIDYKADGRVVIE